MSDDTKIIIGLPLPADVVSSLVKAIGQMYPNSRMSTISGDHLELIISEKDRKAGASIKGLEHEPAEGDEPDVIGMENDAMQFATPQGQNEAMQQLGVLAKVILDSTEGASNYVELKVHDPETYKSYVIIACRSEKQTPHELRQASEKKLSAIAALTAMPGQPSKKALKQILEGP